jgi:hypothetical protein
MDMKNRFFTLAGMLGLSLLTSVTLAEKPGQDPVAYLPSENLIQPISGVIKKCTAGTLFKNVDPFISGGNPDPSDFPIVRAESFLVDGSEVELIVSWDQDNSFSYAFAESKEGLMWEIGVENNSDKIIYKNDNPGPLTSDSGLNKVEDGVSDKANHIDICISPLDATPPGIEFESPLDGDTVSGESVPVIVKVTDESGLTSVLLSVNDGQTTDVAMTCLETNTTLRSSRRTAQCRIRMRKRPLSLSSSNSRWPIASVISTTATLIRASRRAAT